MTQSFNELVEARAKKNYGRGWVSCPAESIRNDYLEDAKKALFLEYAQKHPQAIEELIMGRAAVVETHSMDGEEFVGLVTQDKETGLQHHYFFKDYRIDTIQEIPTAGEKG